MRPNDLTPEEFQRRCLEGCARILGPEWVPGKRFERVHGARDYWRGEGDCRGRALQVYVYEDGAEFGLAGRDVNVYEWPDFAGLEALAEKFLQELRAAVHGGGR